VSEAGLVRAFLAVPADPAWVESARELLARLRRDLPDASWTKPESWHVTLHFLGERPPQVLSRFADDVARAASATPEGQLTSSGAAVFPPRGPARVLAAGFAGTPFTDALCKLAAAAASLAPPTRNAKPETRDFHPHVTFARLRRPWPPQAVATYRAALSAWQPPPWRVRSCVLFQSRLDPGGAVHTPLSSWSFSEAPVSVEVSR
jgi:2'-5' RNA ligase